MILWELAARQIPYSDARDTTLIIQWVMTGDREEIPQDTPPFYAALIGKCWKQRAEERPTIEEAVRCLEDHKAEVGL